MPVVNGAENSVQRFLPHLNPIAILAAASTHPTNKSQAA